MVLKTNETQNENKINYRRRRKKEEGWDNYWKKINKRRERLKEESNAEKR